MSYFLYLAVLGKFPREKLSEAEYSTIINASEALQSVLHIEELWDSTVQNYIELETEFLTAATHSMVKEIQSYDEFHDVRLAFTRRLGNLLQTCRAYLDQTDRLLKSMGRDDLASAFQEFRRNEYDGNFSYRFMEKLRNYGQHRGLPMHGVTFHSRWEDIDAKDDKRMRVTMLGRVNLAEIRQDSQFSSSILRELDEGISSLDISKLVREYVGGLSAVHCALRVAIEADLAGWLSSIRGALARYAAVNNGNVLGLCVGEFVDGELVRSEAPIFEDLPERIEALVGRNGNLTNLSKRYVSGALKN
jgi:hypothetical protein